MTITPEQRAALFNKLNAIDDAANAISNSVVEMTQMIDALTEVPPPPPPPSPSGEPMPTTDIPGWEIAWSEDFNKPAAEGKIRDVYGDKMMFYPPTAGTAFYTDTSKRGHYEAQNFSAEGSLLRLHVYTSTDGIHHVGAWLPTLSAKDAAHGQYGSVTNGRFAVRFRSDPLSTYKQAWMLWPMDGKWPEHGEIDFPERSLNGDTLQGFMHREGALPESQGGLGGKDQDRVSVAFDKTKWHTCVTEWEMGKVCKFFLDGKLLGTFTDRVPAHPMRWTLQTETSLDKTQPINNSVHGYVEVDWAYYSKKVA